MPDLSAEDDDELADGRGAVKAAAPARKNGRARPRWTSYVEADGDEDTDEY